MEKELLNSEKQLLLKDLCARVPYGVILNCCDFVGEKLYIIDNNGLVNNDYDLEEVKPYLFPLSSMTEEQKSECFKGTPLEIDKYGDIAVKDNLYGGSQYTDLEIYLGVIGWLLKNHFDIYGLIEKGLTIDCTNLNIY